MYELLWKCTRDLPYLSSGKGGVTYEAKGAGYHAYRYVAHDRFLSGSGVDIKQLQGETVIKEHNVRSEDWHEAFRIAQEWENAAMKTEGKMAS